MTPEEALEILVKVCETVVATRRDHSLIDEALNLVREKIILKEETKIEKTNDKK